MADDQRKRPMELNRLAADIIEGANSRDEAVSKDGKVLLFRLTQG